MRLPLAKRNRHIGSQRACFKPLQANRPGQRYESGQRIAARPTPRCGAAVRAPRRLVQLWGRVDHRRLGPRVSRDVLDVGHVGGGPAQPGGERVADLVGGKHVQAGSSRGAGERVVDAAAGPGPKASAWRKTRAAATPSGTSGTAAIRPPFPRGTATWGIGPSRRESSARSRPICAGRMPVQCISSNRTRVTDPAGISASTSAMWGGRPNGVRARAARSGRGRAGRTTRGGRRARGRGCAGRGGCGSNPRRRAAGATRGVAR